MNNKISTLEKKIELILQTIAKFIEPYQMKELKSKLKELDTIHPLDKEMD